MALAGSQSSDPSGFEPDRPAPLVLPSVSIVIPVLNEQGNIGPLIVEIEGVMALRDDYEVVVVDDASTDDTTREVRLLGREKPWLRLLRHDTCCGQSAALLTGVAAARAPVVVTIDGDGQNDPRAIPAMLAELAEAGPVCGLVAAQRVGRHDPALRRLHFKIASVIRGSLLEDGARDASCGLRCFPRDVFLDLPFFDGLHRFMPALVRRDGFAISYVDVRDRPRRSGRGKTGFFHHLWTGFTDVIGVYWLVRRRRHIPLVSEPSPLDEP